MVTRVQSWGNSQGLRLSKRLLEEVGIAVGDALDVVVEDGRIVLSPARAAKSAMTLNQLVREIPPDYSASEVEWGKSEGNEVW